MHVILDSLSDPKIPNRQKKHVFFTWNLKRASFKFQANSKYANHEMDFCNFVTPKIMVLETWKFSPTSLTQA